MGTTAQAILDLSLRQRVRLAGYENHLVGETIRLLDQSDRELTGRIADALAEGRSPETVRRLRSLRDELRGVNREAYARAGKHLTEELKEFGARIGPASAELMEGALPFAFSFTRPSPGLLRSIITSQPFQGDLIGPHIDKLAGNRLAALTSAMEQGLTQGDSLSEILISVRGRKVGRRFVGGVLDAHQVGRPALEGLVRTATQHVQTTAQQRLYEANSDLVRGVMWVATLDHRTCFRVYRLGEKLPGCQRRDGLVWDYDPETGEYVPVGHDIPWHGGPGRLHWRDRCAPAAVLRGVDAFERAGVDVGKLTAGERAAMGGPVPVTETYETWIRKQPREIQEIALGKRRAAALRDGGTLSEVWAKSFVVRAAPARALDDVVPEAPRPLTIAEIKEELRRIDEETQAENLAIITEKTRLKERLQARRVELRYEETIAERKAASAAIDNATNAAERKAGGARLLAVNDRWNELFNDPATLALEEQISKLTKRQGALLVEGKRRRGRAVFTRNKPPSGLDIEADDFLRSKPIKRLDRPFDETWEEATEWLDAVWQRPLTRHVKTNVHRVNGQELTEWLNAEVPETWWGEAVERALDDLPSGFRGYSTSLYARSNLGKVPGRVIARALEDLEDNFGSLKFTTDIGVTVERKLKIEALLLERNRAYASGSRIFIAPNGPGKTIVHEVGHVLEDFDEEIHRRILEFMARRTEGNALEKMGGGYRDDEVTLPDKFLHRYMGKVYPRQDATEILSMGLEMLFDDPWGLLEDEDYFDFILGLLGHQ